MNTDKELNQMLIDVRYLNNEGTVCKYITSVRDDYVLMKSAKSYMTCRDKALQFVEQTMAKGLHLGAFGEYPLAIIPPGRILDFYLSEPTEQVDPEPTEEEEKSDE